jgi:hypothetical protein
LKFFNNEQVVDTSEIIKLLTNSSFEIYVCRENIPLYKVTYQILSTKIADSEITFGIYYPNPLNVSNSQIPETLRIVNLYNIIAVQQ